MRPLLLSIAISFMHTSIALAEGLHIKQVDPTSKPRPPLSTTNTQESTIRRMLADHIHQQIYTCWDVPPPNDKEDQLVVVIEVDYDTAGIPTKILLPQSSHERYRTDSRFRSIADSALRAIRHCAPLQNMPDEHYHIWRRVDMTFTPNDRLPTKDEAL